MLDGKPFENLAVCEFCLFRTVGMTATWYPAFAKFYDLVKSVVLLIEF